MRIVLVSLAFLVVSGAAAASVSRDVLWAVTRSCVVAERTLGRPFPCLKVKLRLGSEPGFAVLKAPLEHSEVVVMPTETVSGVEDPALQKPAGGVYWRAALDARRFVTKTLNDRVALADIGLAVNSKEGRSQDQLHIHVDCVRPAVREALRANARLIGPSWRRLPFKLEGNHYFARKVGADAIDGLNPFSEASHLPGTQNLKATSLAMIPTPEGDPEPGYYLLALKRAESHAEILLDHSCAIAGQVSAR